MFDVNVWAVVVVVLVGFVLSTLYYIAFSKQYAEQRVASGLGEPPPESTPPPWKIAVELVRNVAVALVLAGLISELDLVNLSGALLLALALWIAFPLVLLSGSVLWDGVAWKLAAIHAGDWLIKLVFMTVVIGLWR